MQLFFLRLLDYLLNIPNRFWRFVKWLLWLTAINGKNKFLRWFAGSFLLAIDITPIPFLVEVLMDLFKPKSRPLNEKEIFIAESVFGQALPTRLIRIDPTSYFVKKSGIIAFVTLHTVNIDREVSDNAFVHELVHIWQYRNMGSSYISEAIWGQKWGGGYDYGGFIALKENLSRGLAAFNLEQQADIIEEYFRLTTNMPLQWTPRLNGLEEILRVYLNEVKE
ncbi:MAG TPA: hypothetical protein VMZ69_02090 [Saprospiraceae bacterium]|nr:hypothetical protein [Saprospiraceae bacterium]